MVVNSFIFWGFFLAFLIPYFAFFRNNSKLQNIWLLLGSYGFFAYSELKMLPIIIVTTAVFYFLGIEIEKSNESGNSKRASMLTTVGVVIGLGMFIYFKYLNFLIDEFTSLFNMLGWHVNRGSFKIVMLLGVSYFTFKLMGYLIEVNRGTMKACRDYIAFSTFVAFFPTLLAGPIDRANQFIPQLSESRKINADNVSEGLKRILWGMFMKMCIADNVSPYVDNVFDNYAEHNGTTILFACVLYIFQSYTDFCGYSNMAIGVGQIMGIKVRENFNRPLFGQNIPELWRRWHMSLTTWVTDYLFMPMNVAFRNLGMTGVYLATFLNMVIIGSWHGASWTYVIFGLYQGVLVCIATALDKKRKKFEKKHELKHKWYYVGARRLLTFVLFIGGTTMIRANSASDLFGMIGQAFCGFGQLYFNGKVRIFIALLCLCVLLFKERKDENNKDIHFLHSKKRGVYLCTTVLMLLIVYYFGTSSSSFIYFNF